MSLKLSVGLSKKLGLPNYGSVGASCHVEFEVDATLFQDDLDGFHGRVQSAYTACRQAVQDELNHHQPGPSGGSEGPADRLPAVEPGSEGGETEGSNGHSDGNGWHGATQKQLDYVQQLARQIKGLGTRRLDSLAQAMFSKPVVSLSVQDASCLIDCLKSIKSNEVDFDIMLSGMGNENGRRKGGLV